MSLYNFVLITIRATRNNMYTALQRIHAGNSKNFLSPDIPYTYTCTQYII